MTHAFHFYRSIFKFAHKNDYKQELNACIYSLHHTLVQFCRLHVINLMELWPMCQIGVKICDIEMKRSVFDHISYVQCIRLLLLQPTTWLSCWNSYVSCFDSFLLFFNSHNHRRRRSRCSIHLCSLTLTVMRCFTKPLAKSFCHL